MNISVLSQKGGCGKTSLSVLIALALASTGKKVLAVDCDPQGGFTAFLMQNGQEEEIPGLFDLLGNYKKLEEVTVKVNRDNLSFDLIPSDYRLDQIAPSLDPYSLKRKFKDVKDYDYILFDTPPTVQGISRSAAIVADKIYIPSDISATSLGPTLYTLNSLKDIEKKGQVIFVGFKEPDEDKKGYVADLSRRFMDKLNGHYIGSVPKTVTTAKVIADPSVKWTQSKIDSILNPLLELLEK